MKILILRPVDHLKCQNSNAHVIVHQLLMARNGNFIFDIERNACKK